MHLPSVAFHHTMPRQMPVLGGFDAYEYAIIDMTGSYPTNNEEWKTLSADDVGRINGTVLWAPVPTSDRHANRRFYEVHADEVAIHVDGDNKDPAYLYKILRSVSTQDIMLVRRILPVALVVSLDHTILHVRGTPNLTLVTVTATSLSGEVVHTLDFWVTPSEGVKYSVNLRCMIHNLFQFVRLCRSMNVTLQYSQVRSTSKDPEHAQETNGEAQQDATVRHYRIPGYARQRQWLAV
jgi:hypothetical protein